MKKRWMWRAYNPTTESVGAPTTKDEAQVQVDSWGGKLQRVKVLVAA